MSASKISKVIRECYFDLTQKGFYSPELVAFLYSKNCINEREKAQVNECAVTTFEKCEKLLDILEKKSDPVLDKILAFFQCDGTKHHLGNFIIEAALRHEYEFQFQFDNFGSSHTNTRSRIQILTEKWWPEKKRLINSFVERKSHNGELLVAQIRQQLLFSEGHKGAIVSKLVIVGMGGIGKTSTAKWYANQYENEYDHIVWINSEGQSLENSFCGLGDVLGTSRGSSETLKSFAKKIYNQFDGLQCLFIFDNAERFYGDNGLEPVLPRQHTIVTSRNHDWGNPAEFGEIPKLIMDVFSPEDCLSILSNWLPTAKLGSEIDMLALGHELGFLPLALQCAVATICKSNSYTVTTYLQRIREDMKVVMDKRLDEYGRKVSAALKLSLEQIQQDDRIDEECRELCMSILYVAAYFEPSIIPVDLLRKGLTKSALSEHGVTDALDQLVSYSILSKESNSLDQSAWYGIHRLVQHVIRDKAKNDLSHAARALCMVFRFLGSDKAQFERYRWLVKYMWAQASLEFDDIVREFSHFPYDIYKQSFTFFADSDQCDFTKAALVNVKRVFKDWDLPVVQLQLRLAELLLYDQKFDEARSLHDYLLEMLNNQVEGIPFKAELVLHTKISLLIMENRLRGSSGSNHTDTRHKLEGLLMLCKNILEEMSVTGYDGVLQNTVLHLGTPERSPACSLRWELIAIYADLSCDLVGLDEAVQVVKSELAAQFTAIDLTCAHSIQSRMGDIAEYKLSYRIIPDLYQIIKRNTNEINGGTGYSIEQADKASCILSSYVFELQKLDFPIVATLDLLTFLSEIKCPSIAVSNMDWIINVAIAHIIKTPTFNQKNVQDLTMSLANRMWKNLLVLCKNPSLQKYGQRRETILAHLFNMNTIYSYALLLLQELEIISSLDSSLMEILIERPADWILFNEELNRIWWPIKIEDVDIPQNLILSDPKAKNVLESKQKLLKLITTVSARAPVVYMQRDVGLASFMTICEKTCYIQISLSLLEEAMETWSSMVQFVIRRNISLWLMARFGRHIFNLMEQNRTLSNILAMYMAEVSKGMSTALPNFKPNHRTPSYNQPELKDALQLIRRLVNHEHYDTVCEFVRAMKSVNMEVADQLLPLIPELKQLGTDVNIRNEEKQSKVGVILNKLSQLLLNAK